MICSLVCASSANIGQHSGANGGSKSARKAQLLEILQGHPNRPFSEILLRGDQGKLAEKVGRTKGLKNTLGRQWRDLLISLRVKCKHWTTFWRKLRLQKCPHSPVMRDFARTPKSPIFGDFAKGGPRANGEKNTSN